MSSATSSPPLKPAVLAQRYRLDRRLAQGGMAEVWLGFDLQLSRQVAVKVLKAALASDPVVAERFRREAIAVAQLSHPNIVTVYDSIEENGRQAVVMQLINGKSLRQLLDEQKRLSPDLTMHIGCAVASALDCAHQANLVHRDVKPGNILITPDGKVLLTDFGIAKGVEPTEDDDLTNDNIMMGTAKYLSPEQVRGRRLDGRADLYSLGLVLYECLAGRVPFIGQNDIETALARLQREPTDITSLRPTLPYGLAHVIHRLLARRPGDRYASGAAVRAALTDVQSGIPDPTLGDVTGERLSTAARRDRTPAGGAGATVPGPAPIDPAVRASQAARTERAALGPTVGGYTPVRAGRDRTPTNPVRPQPRPNREFEQRRGPSLFVVGALLLGAAVLGAVLWTTRNAHDGETFTTLAPGVVTTPLVAATAPGPTIVPSDAASTTPTLPAGLAAFAGAQAFDPDGDGQENDELTALAVDGDPSTAWTTVCYSSRYLLGKGIAVSLAAPGRGDLTIDLANGPWNIDVFASAADQAPSSLAGWGERIASDSDTTARSFTVPVITPARHFLVVFHEIGPSPQCSNDNPYRGEVADVRFEANS